MTLEKVTHIEGFEGYETRDTLQDTPPGGVLAEFFVDATEMPFLSAQEGKTIRENKLYVRITMELGRSQFVKRIRDDVQFDEAARKWVIKKLLPQDQSYILRYLDEWNAFQRSVKTDEVGTPLSLLFKNDPAKVLHLKSMYIHTVEHLASLNPTDAGNLGMGGREDVQIAQNYLKRVEQNAGNNQITQRMDEKDRVIDELMNRVRAAESKLTEVYNEQKQAEADEPVKKTWSRRKKDSTESTGI